MSEYGCNTPYPRAWGDVPVLFGTNMAPVWSGGIAFSYFPATSDAGDFGIVNISADGSTVTTGTDYTNLKNSVWRRDVRKCSYTKQCPGCHIPCMPWTKRQLRWLNQTSAYTK